MGLSTLNTAELTRSDPGATQESPPTVTLQEAERPIPPSPREALSLNGPWQFRPGADAAPRETQVPGCWESQFPDLRGWAGSALYERSFTVPESFRGKRVLLHFEAVDYFTEVWINEQFVGKHEGGYTPFAFDIADALLWSAESGENRIRVRVTDCTPEEDVPLPDGSGTLSFAEIPHGKQSWYTPVSGIWQSVTLEARSFVSIEHLAVSADLDASRARVRIALTEKAAETQNWRIRLTITPPEGAGAVEDVHLDVEPGSHSVETFVDIPDARAWSPEHPNLYILTATLTQGDDVNDLFQTRFGLRKIETREGHVWLNNEPYFVIGALDQAFYPKTIYTAPSEEYLRDQFQKAKHMGLNLMRCHIKVPSTRYLDLCDEMGLLVWYEVPNGMVLSQPMRERIALTFQEMLARDGNHPCIVIKSIMNESWGIDLGDPEQRDWLTRTYHWAKEHAPDKLIVDNSACIPNFHVISDLDDYHVYYNIPDQADEFSEWINSFADRDAGSYSGFGDANRKHTEPLLISEFGNWGLPHHDKLVEAEGELPWWFNTGAGITYPGGVLTRFEKQKLGRAFRDYNALADASQEQEWLALKYQIEEMRRRREVAGYVVTEFSDINWESNGLLDFGRNPKIFHDRLFNLQQQDLLIPRTSRHSYWSGETVQIEVQFSKFSARHTSGSSLSYSVLGIEGRQPIPETPRGETTHLGAILFRAPDVDQPVKAEMEISLRGPDGRELCRTSKPLVLAPSAMRRWGAGRTAWVHDPHKLVPDLAERLQEGGFRILEAGETPDENSLGFTTHWDSKSTAYVQNGGKAVLVALSPKSLLIASGLGQRLQERALNNWWGDWCSSQTWFIPSEFPYLPDVQKFDFEYSAVVPKRVLTGASQENVLAGLFVGWLHNPTGYVIRQGVGKGRLVTTTFDVLTTFHDDPIATLMAACFAEQLTK
jgi:hypothetical protein